MGRGLELAGGCGTFKGGREWQCDVCRCGVVGVVYVTCKHGHVIGTIREKVWAKQS